MKLTRSGKLLDLLVILVTNINSKKMNKQLKLSTFLIIPIICCVCLSCETDKRTTKAIEWVNTHPKPIIITSISKNGLTNNYRCMFRDSAGQVYYAGEVEGFKPDTIKIHITNN